MTMQIESTGATAFEHLKYTFQTLLVDIRVAARCKIQVSHICTTLNKTIFF